VNYRTIKNCGEVGIEFCNIDSDGARVSRDFLRRLVINIIRRSTDYHDETGEPVFFYRERQFHSVVCPSIADITSSYLMEHPLRRRPVREKEFTGHVDYWIGYRDYSFLMELKHCYFGYRRANNPRRSIAEKFNSAMEQLKNIRKDECRDIIFSVRAKGLIKIALQTIVFYEGSRDQISIDELRHRDFKGLFKGLVENTDLSIKSNLRCLWVLHERLIKSFEYGGPSFEVYPAVAFVGNISEMIW